MLTLSFYIAFAPAVAYADDVTDKIDKLQIDLQKRVGDKWTLSPRNKSVGAGVEIGATQSYPVTATTTATTAAGATTSNTATLTAEKFGSKIFTPTTANIAKRFAGGVATSLVAIAIYDALGKAVDYVLDPANNSVIIKPKEGDGVTCYTNSYTNGGCVYTASQAMDVLKKTFNPYEVQTCIVKPSYIDCPYRRQKDSSLVSMTFSPTGSATQQTMSFQEAAQRAINQANKGNTEAQSGMQTVVNDMITNNEIDNSYFNDADISNDTYNDVTNNYVTNNITNQYPTTKVATQSEMAQAAANGQSSVTKTTQNANGTTTTTTTNFTTTNNNTYNITNITVNNPTADKDDSSASSPASTTTPTDSKPFELPAFCDWAKPVCDFIDWVKADPNLEGSPVPTDNTPLKNPADFDKDYINVIAQCPDDVERQIPVGSTSFTLLFPMSPLCDFLSTYARPVIILMAYITAALSIGNAFRVGG